MTVSDQEHQIAQLQAQVAEQKKQLAETRVSLNLIYGASETLAELLDPATLAQRALDLTCQELAVLRGEFFEVTEEGQLALLALSGYSDALALQLRNQLEMRLQQGIAREVMKTGQPLILRDTTCSESWMPIPDVDDGICSAAGLPLCIDNTLVGVLCLLSDENDFFTQERLPFLTALVTPVALALQNAKLHAAEKEARRAAEILRAASMAFADKLAFETILASTLDYLSQLLRYDCATVLFLDQHYLFVTAQRLHDDQPNGQQDGQAVQARSGVIDTSGAKKLPEPSALTSLPLGRYLLLQKLIATKEALLVGDVEQLAEQRQLPMWRQGRSWLGLPLIADGVVLGVLIIERLAANAFTKKQCEMAEALTTQAAVAIHNAQLFQDLQISRQQLRLLTEQLINAQEEERQHIAQELHDEAGQVLTAIKIQLFALVQELSPVAEHLQQYLTTVQQLVEQATVRVRRLAYGLRPPELDTVGLDAALELLCNEFMHQMAIKIDYQGTELPQLSDAANISFYRFVQEALTNVAKHANASTVTVEMGCEEQRVYVNVKDNGQGFAVQSYSTRGAQSLGLGLLGMVERFEALQGQVQIASTPGQGTTLRASAPISIVVNPLEQRLTDGIDAQCIDPTVGAQ
jgi:signal transduction histidine kinase